VSLDAMFDAHFVATAFGVVAQQKSCMSSALEACIAQCFYALY